jgi:DNA-binding Lrp family transcriptional regulator
MDAIDRNILRLLQRDGRISNSDLATAVNLSASACLRRVRLLEESGVIAGYYMALSKRKAGFNGNAFLFVSLDQQGRQALDQFEEAAKQLPEIIECYLIAGQSDYLMHVVYDAARGLEEIHTKIITELPGVIRVNTTMSLRTVKESKELPI